MSNYEEVLSRLEAVRRTGPNTAIARCPAHADRRPSLNVKDPDGSGTVLVKCRSMGCDFHEIRVALGLPTSAFFPPKPATPQPWTPAPKPKFPAADILAALGDELALAYLVINDFHDFILSKGEKGSWPDGTTTERLKAAIERVLAGATEATGRGITEDDIREYQRVARLTPQEEKDIDDLMAGEVTLGKKQQQEKVA